MPAETDSKMQVKKHLEEYLSSCAEYTDGFERDKIIKDWGKKASVAAKVVGDFKARVGSVEGKWILDVGFGSGMYSIAFAKAGAEVFGVEVNSVLKKIAEEGAEEEGVRADFRVYDGTTFPFEDGFFDYIFSVSVLEHVTDTKAVMHEAHRVLKPGGKFYLAFPNRWRPREGHTGIFFLSYLPRSLAQFLMRRVWKRNTIEELNLYFLSYWTMKKLLRDTSFRIQFEYGGTSAPRRALKRLLGLFGIHHSAILGTIMVILEKRV